MYVILVEMIYVRRPSPEMGCGFPPNIAPHLVDTIANWEELCLDEGLPCRWLSQSPRP